MKRLQLSTLKDGARFVYGGVEWVKLEHLYTESGKLETVAIAAEPVFERAFDEENCNDWRKSSLRRELNGPFLDTLIAEGADPAAFKEFESDLTADDGMTDYGTARDKIALITCDLYREHRALLPKIGCWWWTLNTRPTPATSIPPARWTGTSRTTATGAFARFVIWNLQSLYLFQMKRECR